MPSSSRTEGRVSVARTVFSRDLREAEGDTVHGRESFHPFPLEKTPPRNEALQSRSR